MPTAPPASQQVDVQSAQLSRSEPGRTAPAGPAAPPPVYALPPIPSLVIPVEGVAPRQLVDTFTQARAGGMRRHDAIDIMAPTGTPVRAASAGRLEKLFLSRDGGNTIYLRSPDRRVIYYYAHLDQYAPDLVEGQPVSAGQVIGTVGFSGNANPAGPHLHFAMLVTRPEARWHEQAMPVNPYPLLTRR
ncbi:M23 family metallopeptidase [Novosphingobium sp.]|uniref:M23 family metallopeptidase n=1 Tax=Novosphingobium sp. TaxID=1874826 RepID=UPI00286DE226|nr:M23 family metallopeptidase [Novosphingobium sp.]